MTMIHGFRMRNNSGGGTDQREHRSGDRWS